MNQPKTKQFTFEKPVHIAEDTFIFSAAEHWKAEAEKKGDTDQAELLGVLHNVAESLGSRAVHLFWQENAEELGGLTELHEIVLANFANSKAGMVMTQTKKALDKGLQVMVITGNETEAEYLEKLLQDELQGSPAKVEWDPEDAAGTDVLLCCGHGVKHFVKYAAGRVVLSLVGDGDEGNAPEWVENVVTQCVHSAVFFFLPSGTKHMSEVKAQIELGLGRQLSGLLPAISKADAVTCIQQHQTVDAAYQACLSGVFKYTEKADTAPPVEVDDVKPDPVKSFLDAKIRGSKWEISLDQIKFGAHLGTGGYGVVQKAQYNGREVAAKSFAAGKVSVESFAREAKMLIELQDSVPSVIRLHGFIFFKLGNMGIVTKLYNEGDLKKYRRGPGQRNTPAEWCRFMRLLAGGLSTMLEKQVVHRDLKPENILVDKTPDGPQPVIADLGLAKHFHSMSHTGIKGTELYIAPEVRDGVSPPSEKSDVYAFGMIFWYVLSGLTEDSPSYTKAPAGTRRECDLIRKCLEYEPHERPTLRSIEAQLGEMTSTVSSSGTGDVPDCLSSPEKK